MEVGNDINKLDIFRRFKDFFEGFRNHALIIGRDFLERAFVRLESVDGSKVGRSLHEDHVAGVQENLAGHIEVLLGTRCNQDVFHLEIGVVDFVHAVSNLLSQGGSAFGRCVLENFAAFFGADFLGNLTDFIDREKFRCGQTAGKGDDFRALGYFQDLTDGRCFHAGHAAC